jgi:hypothetical protein
MNGIINSWSFRFGSRREFKNGDSTIIRCWNESTLGRGRPHRKKLGGNRENFRNR